MMSPSSRGARLNTQQHIYNDTRHDRHSTTTYATTTTNNRCPTQPLRLQRIYYHTTCREGWSRGERWGICRKTIGVSRTLACQGTVQGHDRKNDTPRFTHKGGLFIETYDIVLLIQSL